MHLTFLLFLGYVAWEGWEEDHVVGALTSVVTLLVFFTCVVLHELGHAFTARRFGAIVPSIVLLPIGGMAVFTTMPRRPAHEIMIALAGPAVNFALLLGLSFFTTIPSWPELRNLELDDLQLLFAMNLMMGCFNLLPVFPMDGGRVLRALLAQRMDYAQATRWAAGVGKILGLLGILAMLILPASPHLMGALLFGFIMVAGEMEYRAVLRQKSAESRSLDHPDDKGDVYII